MVYRTLLSMVYRAPFPMYFDLTAFGILNPMPMVCWPYLSMVVWPSNHGILSPLPIVLCIHYQWYIKPLIRGISNPLPMVIWIPLPMVFGYPYPWYLYPLPIGYRTTHGIHLSIVCWPPTHGILTPIHGISNLYPWYLDTSTHGIWIPLPMVFWPPYQ
jgi:hypothetical protein